MPGMRNVTMRQLQVFAAAARNLSFSRASEELHLSQPAVSMQIRQLEDSAGLPLFERSSRRLQLTQAGEEMARYAQQMLLSLKEAEDRFLALKGLKGGAHCHCGGQHRPVLRPQAAGLVRTAASGGRNAPAGEQPRAGDPESGRQ